MGFHQGTSIFTSLRTNDLETANPKLILVEQFTHDIGTTQAGAPGGSLI